MARVAITAILASLLVTLGAMLGWYSAMEPRQPPVVDTGALIKLIDRYSTQPLLAELRQPRPNYCLNDKTGLWDRCVNADTLQLGPIIDACPWSPDINNLCHHQHVAEAPPSSPCYEGRWDGEYMRWTYKPCPYPLDKH